MNTIYCDGNLFEAYVDSKSVVNLNVYAVSRVESQLLLRDKFEFNSTSVDITIEKVGTFQDSNSGIRKPFILVKCRLAQTYYLLSLQGRYSKSLITSANKLCANLFLKTKESISVKNSLQVIDGPHLLWHCTRNIYLAFQTQTSLNTHTLPVDVESTQMNEMTSFSVLVAVACEDDIFIFIRCNCQSNSDSNSKSLQDSKILVWNLRQESPRKLTKRELDLTDFFPTEYAASIVDCIMTLQPANLNDKNVVAASDIVLLLEGFYVVQLTNGVLKRCSHINDTRFTEPTHYTDWKLIHVFNGTKCVMWTSNSEITVFDLDVEEISQTWHDVSSVNVGDFLRRGYKQLFVAFGDGASPGDIGAWLLTDFGGCTIDTRDITEHDREEGVTQSGITNAVETLYSNLQTMLCDLSVKEQHHTNKVKFVHNTWLQLHRNIRRDPTPYKSIVPLVTLIPGRVKQKTEKSDTKDKTLAAGDLEARITWKTTVGSNLVVGVDLNNNTDRTFTKCSLMLVPHSNLTERNVTCGFTKWPPCSEKLSFKESSSSSCSKKMRMDTDVYQAESTSKIERNLKSKGRVALTITTDLANYAFHQDIRFWILLNAREATSIVTETGDAVKENTCETRVMCCGLVNISSRDYLQGKYAISPDFVSSKMETDQDEAVIEASLTTVLTLTRLRLTSTLTDLQGLWGILQDETGFREVPSLHCLSHTSCHPLQFVRIMKPWVISRSCAHLSVWTRDTNQLLLLVQHLYSHLPYDLVITKQTDVKTDQRVALSSLSQELKTISTATRTLLDSSAEDDVKASTGSSSSLSGMKQPENITEYRRTFAEHQTTVQNLEDAMVDLDEVKVMVNRIKQARKKTDQTFGFFIK